VDDPDDDGAPASSLVNGSCEKASRSPAKRPSRPCFIRNQSRTTLCLLRISPVRVFRMGDAGHVAGLRDDGRSTTLAISGGERNPGV